MGLFKEENHLMLQAFIITLREGVEASLIVGIVFAYLTKIGRSELKRTVFWALGAALAASVGGAIILARTQLNTNWGSPISRRYAQWCPRNHAQLLA